ncbi:hypothetical protein [Psychrobacillus sp. FSL H8-0510]|uniref:hypothetical protein n=1 Tax=Psychrobacillus sp. FSL H8-0510 TaxID=2921394 RepID=UPI0030FCDB3E
MKTFSWIGKWKVYEDFEGAKEHLPDLETAQKTFDEKRELNSKGNEFDDEWEDEDFYFNLMIEACHKVGWTPINGGSYSAAFTHKELPNSILKLYNDEHFSDINEGEFPTIDEEEIFSRLPDDERLMKRLASNDFAIIVSKVSGINLDTFLKTSGYPSLQQGIFKQIEDYIHMCLEHHVIPLDLNGSNVLVGEDLKVRFIDYNRYMLLDQFLEFSERYLRDDRTALHVALEDLQDNYYKWYTNPLLTA